MINRFVTVALLLGVAVSPPALSESFNCQFAYTPVEQAICSEPHLKRLDGELDRLSKKAIALNVATPTNIRVMRDRIVRRCRNADHLASCLIEEERAEIATLAHELFETTEIPASAKGREGVAESWAMRVLAAQSRLESAEILMAQNGNPEPLIVAAVDLLDLYRLGLTRSPTDAALAGKIRGLQDKLLSGCDNRKFGERWQYLLSENGQVCQS